MYVLIYLPLYVAQVFSSIHKENLVTDGNKSQLFFILSAALLDYLMHETTVAGNFLSLPVYVSDVFSKGVELL